MERKQSRRRSGALMGTGCAEDSFPGTGQTARKPLGPAAPSGGPGLTSGSFSPGRASCLPGVGAGYNCPSGKARSAGKPGPGRWSLREEARVGERAGIWCPARLGNGEPVIVCSCVSWDFPLALPSNWGQARAPSLPPSLGHVCACAGHTQTPTAYRGFYTRICECSQKPSG